MDRESCLKRHLLYASVEAYHPRPPFYSARARWIAPPAAIDPGPPRIDFALAGRFAEGIVIAFRGTLPPVDLCPDGTDIVGELPSPTVIRDWLNNIDLRPDPDVSVAGEIMPGRVHRGFARSLHRLWPGVAGAVDALRGGETAFRLYFTGHSKGGALANLAAVRALRSWPSATVATVTFGAARAGDADFASAYQLAGIVCHRYEVKADVVPDVPLAGRAVGALHDIAEIRHPFRLGDDRWLLRGPIGAHLPYRGFGYGENVCEPDCNHDWS